MNQPTPEEEAAERLSAYILWLDKQTRYGKVFMGEPYGDNPWRFIMDLQTLIAAAMEPPDHMDGT